MTPDERRLLAAISRWRRDEGWVNVGCGWGSYESADRRTRVDLPALSEIDENEGWGLVGVSRRGGLGIDHDATSVTEAVDVLCALGVLPAAKFSSAYRAGWADGETAGLLRAAEFEHNRQVALTAMAVLTPDAEVT